MTPDRRSIIEYVWHEMYSRRCRCGRCDCIDSDPREVAMRVLFHFGQQYLRLAAVERGRAEVFVELARKLKRKKFDYDWVPTRLAEYEHERAKHERSARRLDRAARRLFRIWRGRAPFVPHPEDKELAP